MSSVLVLQSAAAQAPAWQQRCMGSVQAWAADRGYAYRFFGDELFEQVPDWYLEKVRGRMPIAADLGRLQWIERLLSKGYSWVLWFDADVLIFAPNRLDVTLDQSCVFGQEHWVQAKPKHESNNGSRGSVRWDVRKNIHNAFAAFPQSCPVPDNSEEKPQRRCEYFCAHPSEHFLATHYSTHVWVWLAPSALAQKHSFDPALHRAGLGRISTHLRRTTAPRNTPWTRAVRSIAAGPNPQRLAYDRAPSPNTNPVPDWYLEKVRGRMPIAADLGRLQWIERLLSKGYSWVLWFDADVLIFAPNRLDVTLDQSCVFGQEHWVQAKPKHESNNGSRGSVRWDVRKNIHNAFAAFPQSCPVPDNSEEKPQRRCEYFCAHPSEHFLATHYSTHVWVWLAPSALAQKHSFDPALHRAGLGRISTHLRRTTAPRNTPWTRAVRSIAAGPNPQRLAYDRAPSPNTNPVPVRRVHPQRNDKRNPGQPPKPERCPYNAAAMQVLAPRRFGGLKRTTSDPVGHWDTITVVL